MEKSGLSVEMVRRCIREGLVAMDLGQADLKCLRRIRRLHALGVNLHGIEIILRIRRQITDLQVQLARTEQLCSADKEMRRSETPRE